VATYKQKRDALRAQLDKLKTAYATLKQLLASPRSASVGQPPEAVTAEDWGQLAAERGRVDTLGKVLDNAKQQIAVLEQILQLLQTANDAVDQAVKTVQELADAADAEAKASTEGFERLLKMVLSGDPEAAAEQWLEDELARRTKAALSGLGWPAASFVDYLLGNATDEDLRNTLLLALDGPIDLTLTSTEQAAIKDVAWAATSITVPNGGKPSQVTVSVDIQHPDVSDLFVELQHDRTMVMIRKASGSGANLKIDLEGGDWTAHDMAGKWTLWIWDGRAGNTGTLRGWTLHLHGN